MSWELAKVALDGETAATKIHDPYSLYPIPISHFTTQLKEVASYTSRKERKMGVFNALGWNITALPEGDFDGIPVSNIQE